MEQVIAKLVARACYLSKKILEDIQDREEPVTETELESRYQLCLQDADKTLQLSESNKNTNQGKQVYESLLGFKTSLSKFNEACKAFLGNQFDFQLRQVVQMAHKDIAVQLNIVLKNLEAKANPDKVTASPNVSEPASAQARKVAMCVKLLSDHANAGEVEKFVTVAKQLFLMFKNLQSSILSEKKTDSSAIAEKIGSLSLVLIQSAKELCQNPNDEAAKSKFTLSKQDAAKVLQTILFQERNESSAVQNIAALSRSTSHSPQLVRGKPGEKPTLKITTASTVTEKDIKPKKVTEKKIKKKVEKRKIKSLKRGRATSFKNQFGTPKIKTMQRVKLGGSSEKVIAAVNELQKQPNLFVLHDSDDEDDDEYENQMSKSEPMKTANISLHLPRTATKKRLDSATDTPITPRRAQLRQTRSWKDSIGTIGKKENLDKVLNIIMPQLPRLDQDWKAIPDDIQKDLRDKVDDAILRMELSGRLQASKQWDKKIDRFTGNIIGFASSFFTCVRNLDESPSFLKEREDIMISEYKKLLSTLIDVSEIPYAPLIPCRDVNTKLIKEILASDINQFNEHFVTASKKTSLDYFTQLIDLIAHQSRVVNMSAMRVITMMRSNYVNPSADPLNYIDILASTHFLAKSIQTLMHHYQTAKQINELKKAQSKGVNILDREDLDELVDIDIWVGLETDTSCKTLNSIVKKLTLEYDMGFMKAIIYTYRSFTTPSQLLHKLIRRFSVPPKIDEKTAAAIQLRVGVVLKFWLKNQFNDFDTQLIEELYDFLKKMKIAGHEQLAEGIGSVLEEKVKERQESSHELQLRPDLFVLDLNRLFPTEYIMNFSVQDIAKQLTILDYIQLKAIEPAELMKQSWSSEKLSHNSINVCRCMDRLNMLSYWVPTMVMGCSTLQSRKKMVEWFYLLALELRSINNFQSLMAIVAGFNTSSLQRLKHTIEIIDKDLRKKYLSMEELMSPQSSFKNYRAALKKAHVPAIPFLGVFLSDLTFIDEGNEDDINGEINFAKRELVYDIVQLIQTYQTSRFNYHVLQPLSCLLENIPTLTDDQLYDISLKLEPRGAAKEDIK